MNQRQFLLCAEHRFAGGDVEEDRPHGVGAAIDGKHELPHFVLPSVRPPQPVLNAREKDGDEQNDPEDDVL